MAKAGAGLGKGQSARRAEKEETKEQQWERGLAYLNTSRKSKRVHNHINVVCIDKPTKIHPDTHYTGIIYIRSRYGMLCDVLCMTLVYVARINDYICVAVYDNLLY